ncbi:hypothetical protein [Paenibacillus sp. J2TS4]|uniref:hypothetical protein n=1 Tax=Paenibacillus sp. J2TS4 TaxID=2807194 RepID=UPI001B052EE8|nr:hypothetical protein [Paenibacillus sp. J2TS4]GIP36563.1 hypothetical protein J2TS4_57730 [Paenibacillus sp. J2TS4]
MLKAMKVSIGLSLGLCLILSGCANTNGVTTKSYPNDGFLGTTNANPNYPTSPTYHNYSSDRGMVESALKNVAGIQNSRVVFNGRRLNITVSVPRNTSPEEQQRIEAQALEAVSNMMPRYDVKVVVKRQ